MPATNDKASANSRLWKGTIGGWIFLAIVWLLQNVVGENWWPAVWLVYLPAHWIGLPAGVLCVWALVRRAKKALLANGAALIVWIVFFLGFNIPLQKLGSRSTPTGTKVRVLTYNIHYGSGGVEKLTRIIQSAQPDIVCLQETRAFAGWPDPLPKLKAHFPQWQLKRAGEVAVLSRFPITETREYSMPQPSGRKLLETVIKVNGQKLRVFNAHISTSDHARSWRSDPRAYTIASARTRREQVEMLLEKSAGSSLPTIITGDFNNPPRGVLYRRLKRRYTDAFAAAGRGLGYSFHAALPVLRIDYIWVGRGIRVKSCRALDETASDHWPVVADVILVP